MGLKREFVEKWMKDERLKKVVPSFKKVAPKTRSGADASPAPAPSGGAPAAGVAEAEVQETMRAGPPPALVPFADMDVWYLSNDMHWTLPGGSRTILVPRGFATDFASVPQSFWAWMPPTGRYGLPAIVHDWLYWDQTLLRSQADEIFDNALGELDVSRWRRFVLYKAVRWFGSKYWRENTLAKKQGQGRVLKQFPDDARVTWADWRVRPGVFG